MRWQILVHKKYVVLCLAVLYITRYHSSYLVHHKSLVGIQVQASTHPGV